MQTWSSVVSEKCFLSPTASTSVRPFWTRSARLGSCTRAWSWPPSWAASSRGWTTWSAFQSTSSSTCCWPTGTSRWTHFILPNQGLRDKQKTACSKALLYWRQWSLWKWMLLITTCPYFWAEMGLTAAEMCNLDKAQTFPKRIEAQELPVKL